MNPGCGGKAVHATSRFSMRQALCRGLDSSCSLVKEFPHHRSDGDSISLAEKWQKQTLETEGDDPYPTGSLRSYTPE